MLILCIGEVFYNLLNAYFKKYLQSDPKYNLRKWQSVQLITKLYRLGIIRIIKVEMSFYFKITVKYSRYKMG